VNACTQAAVLLPRLRRRGHRRGQAPGREPRRPCWTERCRGYRAQCKGSGETQDGAGGSV